MEDTLYLGLRKFSLSKKYLRSIFQHVKKKKCGGKKENIPDRGMQDNTIDKKSIAFLRVVEKVIVAEIGTMRTMSEFEAAEMGRQDHIHGVLEAMVKMQLLLYVQYEAACHFSKWQFCFSSRRNFCVFCLLVYPNS